MFGTIYDNRCSERFLSRPRSNDWAKGSQEGEFEIQEDDRGSITLVAEHKRRGEILQICNRQGGALGGKKGRGLALIGDKPNSMMSRLLMRVEPIWRCEELNKKQVKMVPKNKPTLRTLINRF